MQLAHKLVDAAGWMSEEERACLKILLGAAAAELMQTEAATKLGSGDSALTAVVASVAQLQPHRGRVPANAVVYRGRPAFVTDALLESLRSESTSVRNRAVKFHDHLVVSGAPGAREFAYSRALGDLVTAHAGAVEPTSKANYLYYDAVGLGIEPHIDNEEFSLNAIMMLEHSYEQDPSALVLYPPGAPAERIYLQPGELIVMFADSVVHAREPVKSGERVRIVAFGFSPI